MGAPEVCLEWSSGRALAVGAAEDEITAELPPGWRTQPDHLQHRQ